MTDLAKVDKETMMAELRNSHDPHATEKDLQELMSGEVEREAQADGGSAEDECGAESDGSLGRAASGERTALR